jgi:RimJ/RimL family protein N-acetyltransferase
VSVELRRANRSDAGFLLDLLTGDDTRDFLGRVPDTIDDVLADIERSEQEPAVFGWLVAEDAGDGVGCVAYHVLSERHRIAEGNRLVVHPRFRGTGAADEIARAFQRLVLRDLDMHRLELQIFAFNERAIVHAERIGFVREGVKRKAYERGGEWRDAALFSMLAEELPD